MPETPHPHPNIPGPEGYPTYYNLPPIRAGHWRWLIITYFWTGGIAGGSYGLAAIANLFGSKEDQDIARAGRYLTPVMLLISVVLLVKDLGKPSRALHMLRIVKLRSPMSVGTWGGVTFGFFAGMSLLLQGARDGLFRWVPPLDWLGRRLPFRPFEAGGTFFGLFFGGYTGVLVSNTVVPLWARLHRTNGPVFLCSALATSSAALSLLLALAGRGGRGSERKLAIIQGGATVAEAALLAHELHHLGPLRPALTQGKAAPYFYGSVVSGLALPTLLGVPTRRALKVLKAVLTLVGGFLLRAAIVLGGHESANDPQAYFWFTDPQRGAK